MTEKEVGVDSVDGTNGMHEMRAMKMQQQMKDTGDSVSGQEEHIVTVVFTADNHLGYAASSQTPRKREEWQQRLRMA